ncbi:unnamed protein product [marine sediment metagenome]|uniref:Uncharacterized protein n=1 Tax=marine sediment metagenome TaxID=412755 RepID=X1BJT1_9ZZZZ
MKLVWKSYRINKPEINLINDLRHTIINYYMTENPDEYIIRLGGVLFSVLENEQLPPFPQTFKGIKYIEDNSMEDGCYCIYRKEKSIPIELTPVKTLDAWFANLPLIYKIDLYNNYIKIIAENLK